MCILTPVSNSKRICTQQMYNYWFDFHKRRDSFLLKNFNNSVKLVLKC